MQQNAHCHLQGSATHSILTVAVRCQKENVKYLAYRLTGFTSFVSRNTHVSTQELKTELKVIFPHVLITMWAGIE